MTNKVTRAARRPKSFWQDHIKQWKKSGQSKAKYCREQKLNAGTFYNWCSDEAKTRAPKSDKTNVAGRVVIRRLRVRGFQIIYRGHLDSTNKLDRLTTLKAILKDEKGFLHS